MHQPHKPLLPASAFRVPGPFYHWAHCSVILRVDDWQNDTCFILFLFFKEATCQVCVGKRFLWYDIEILCFDQIRDSDLQFIKFTSRKPKVIDDTTPSTQQQTACTHSDNMSVDGGDCCVANPYARRMCPLLKGKAYGFAKAWRFQAIHFFFFQAFLFPVPYCPIPSLHSPLFQHRLESSDPLPQPSQFWDYRYSPRCPTLFHDFKNLNLKKNSIFVFMCLFYK